MPTAQEWIHDWNRSAGPECIPGRRCELNDETLRDGLQSPSVRDPELEDKRALLHCMAELGIERADIGLPGAGPRAQEHVRKLAEEIARARLPLRPNCAARSLESDLTPIAEIQQATGVALEAAIFIGSSPIRRYAEDWTVDFLLRTTRQALQRARELELRIMYVTEDTTRCDPETMRALYRAALEEGAEALVFCDTVGHATPAGVRALLEFARREIVAGHRGIRLDWHGHNDRGLATANALAALEAGADCVHACALGIGERVGNTSMDQMMVNLRLMGRLENDLSRLNEYCQLAARMLGMAIPPNYPVMGRDAFRTSTGVHAAAVIKSLQKQDLELADRVYSGVPAAWFGRRQEIELGPMSGRSNVTWWLEAHGHAASPRHVNALLAAAKASDHVLSDAELETLLGGIAAAPGV